MAEGRKDDLGKAPLWLLDGYAAEQIALVLGYGLKKYGAHNWRGGMAWSRPLSAALRHIFAFIGGEDNDPETGLSHLAHAGCCIMFALNYQKTFPNLDDRWKP